ncbi:MAG TPA: AAA family ATPase, partial [Candidatus Thermoplasmatota archaeon]|nr:AAA family ATPase [Candidatus Thermoplasmatota archaeon]
MRRLHVSNFRSIRQETIALERLTAFVGPNGSGKSSFLRSLHALFSDAAEVTAEDFHGSNTSQPVVLGAELADFTPGEEERFAEYISNGILFVERVFEYREGEVTDSFHGRAPRHAGFACVRM